VPSFTNTFGGTNIYAANVSYRAIALTANVTLTWPTEVATNTNVVASIMDVTPSVGSLTIRMPDASQASVGETALFFNVGAFSFTVADNSGNTIQTIASGEAWQIYHGARLNTAPARPLRPRVRWLGLASRPSRRR